MKNVRKHWDIKLVTTNARRNYLMPTKLSYSKIFSENVLDMEMKIFMNNSIYLGPPILEISRIIIYQFWYDYVKQKY